jgi:hypothetical protein
LWGYDEITIARQGDNANIMAQSAWASQRRLFSPKGWNKPAQGNALGRGCSTIGQALKGRNNPVA